MKYCDKHMNSMDKKHAAKHAKDAKEMMSDSRFMQAMHESAESPEWEALEEKGAKMLSKKKNKGESY